VLIKKKHHWLVVFHSQYSLEFWKSDISEIFPIRTYINILLLIFKTRFVCKALSPYFCMVESNIDAIYQWW
jgi:hypothetical protein